MTRQRLSAGLCALLFSALALFVSPVRAAVDVNRASQAELETVKGIGPGLSGKILAAREKGAFKDWADLQERVSGIGSRNAAKFSGAGLTVAGATLAGEGVGPVAARTARSTAAPARAEPGEKARRSDRPRKSAATE